MPLTQCERNNIQLYHDPRCYFTAALAKSPNPYRIVACRQFRRFLLLRLPFFSQRPLCNYAQTSTAHINQVGSLSRAEETQGRQWNQNILNKLQLCPMMSSQQICTIANWLSGLICPQLKDKSVKQTPLEFKARRYQSSFPCGFFSSVFRT